MAPPDALFTTDALLTCDSRSNTRAGSFCCVGTFTNDFSSDVPIPWCITASWRANNHANDNNNHTTHIHETKHYQLQNFQLHITFLRCDFTTCTCWIWITVWSWTWMRTWTWMRAWTWQTMGFTYAYTYTYAGAYGFGRRRDDGQSIRRIFP